MEIQEQNQQNNLEPSQQGSGFSGNEQQNGVGREDQDGYVQEDTDDDQNDIAGNAGGNQQETGDDLGNDGTAAEGENTNWEDQDDEAEDDEDVNTSEEDDDDERPSID